MERDESLLCPVQRSSFRIAHSIYLGQPHTFLRIILDIFFLTGDLRDWERFLALLGEKRKMNFCAICALEMRFVALDSSSFVMDFRTKQHSKRSGFRPSVRCEVGGLRGKITAEYNGEGPKLKFPRSRIQFRGCYGKMNQEFDRMLGEGDFLIFYPLPP